ncbi:hypothetical protein C8Q77DRAFT_1052554 [Trametes polyzona]|nr:hypothetical protein C8Q77DRAFT_1052554 [Trametes polyzona]
MAQLRAFLDADILGNESRRYTVRQIRHRYMLWNHDGVLHHLGSRYMSALICLLGSLSIAVPGKLPSSPHTHRRLPDMPVSNYVPHWNLVIRIGRDKQRLRYPLLPSDHYWLMHAYTSQYKANAGHDDIEAQRKLSAAGHCYRSIRDTSSHPRLHLTFLQSLLDGQSQEHLQEFVTHVVSILQRRRPVHASIRLLFLRFIISHPDLEPCVRRDILLAISKRVVDDPATSFKAAQIAPTRDIQAGPRVAQTLIIALERALFTDFCDLELHTHPREEFLAGWAHTVVSRVFSLGQCEDRTIDLVWNCLALLALARTHSTQWNGANADTSIDPQQRAAVLEWQTVCILEAVETTLLASGHSASDALPLEVIQGFSGVIRKLWRDWITTPPAMAPPRPVYVSRLICASFLKLAARLEDKTLFDACREYSVSARLWSAQESDVSTSPGLQELASEQLYAALRCGTFFERALVDLVVCTPDMGHLTQAVDTAVTRYAQTDPEHAQELLAWARNRGVAPSGHVVVQVAVALARHGIHNYLDRYVEDPSLSPDERAQVVMAYLKTFILRGRRFMQPGVVVDVVASAVKLSTQITDSEPFVACLQSVALVLVRQGFARSATTLVRDLMAEHPSTASGTTYTRLLLALLRHRHFKLAQRLVAEHASQYPELAQHWHTTFFLQSTRKGASRLASSTPKPRALSGALRSALLVSSRAKHRKAPPAVLTLRFPALYGTSSDPQAALHAIRSLVLAGRMHAAEKVYERICAQEDAAVCTTAGNMLLHAYAARASRGQRVRTAAYAYRTLVQRYAFAPDRVTVNILVRAALSSGKLDAARMRALFDAVVGMGYPAGPAPFVSDGAGDGGTPQLPFGTKGVDVARPFSLGGVQVPRLESPVMYLRHVRPLYRSFVTAFYGVGDVDAARKVVGIMKALEAWNAQWLAEGRDWVVGRSGTRM